MERRLEQVFQTSRSNISTNGDLITYITNKYDK